MVNKRAFMDIVELTSLDAQAIDTDAIGVALVMLIRDGDDLAVQIGADVPPEIVRFALTRLVLSWSQDGPDAFTTLPPRKLRKAV